jgi:hypothetical protein
MIGVESSRTCLPGPRRSVGWWKRGSEGAEAAPVGPLYGEQQSSPDPIHAPGILLGKEAPLKGEPILKLPYQSHQNADE